MKILGLILAGGRATRMGGGDKGLHMLGTARLLDHVIERLGPQVDALALNANGDPTRFAGFGLPVLSDPLPDFPGPLAGVLAGMEHGAANGYTHIATAAADTPFFPGDFVARLVASGADLALAATPGAEGSERHPTFGLWPVALRGDLKEALEGGLRKIVRWTDGHGAATVLFETTSFDPFFNVNTPEDLAEAERILGAGV